MNVEPTEILTTALALPDEERAALAYKLLESLKPPAALSADDPGFEPELERRVTAYEASETTASDWQDVSERLGDALRKKQPS